MHAGYFFYVASFYPLYIGDIHVLAFVRQACGVRAVALCACFAQHHACGIYAYDTHVLVSN